MSEEIVLESGALYSAHGTLTQTADALMQGQCALVPGPCFGVEVQWAPLGDPDLRDPVACVSGLAGQLDSALPAGPRTAFIYCAAKGDLRGFDMQSAGDNSDVPPSALLSVQADACHNALGLDAGRSMVVSNACASGTIAIEVAADLLCNGVVDRAVLFGFDTLSRFVATGFFALGALTPTVARPFDSERDGLSLGEGAALAVLVRREAQTGDIVVAGAGSSNDANHRTGPSRTGEGLHLAAAAALANAKAEPDAVGGVKCHGTATAYNDAMEAKALTTLFGSDYPPCVSLKGAIGHTSGGGSLLEVLLAAEFLRRKALPPTVGFANRGVDEPLPVVADPQALRSPSVLCLSAGFRGRQRRGPATRGPTMNIIVDAFASITGAGLRSLAGHVPWEGDQSGPGDVRRPQVIPRIHPSFGKLMLPDRLAFGVSSLLITGYGQTLGGDTGVSVALPYGSLSTDLRYNESIINRFPSPAVFSATLPSSPVSEITIFHKLKGPNRVFAHGGPSGLFALESAVCALRATKASAMLVVSVVALEETDRHAPHVPPEAPTEPNRAHALLLRGGALEAGQMGLEISSDSPAGMGTRMPGEDYFGSLIEAVADREESTIAAGVPGCASNIQLLRG